MGTVCPNPGPTPPHPRLSDPQLIQQRLLSSPALDSVSTLSTSWIPLFRVAGPNPVVIEFGSESAAQSIIHPSRKVIKFGSRAESVAQSILHGNPVVGSRHRILFAGPLEPVIHPNPVVIERESESAAQSIIHRKTVVIEFGSESAAQSVLPGHSRSSSNNHFNFSKFSRLLRVARAA